ncbi:hypothetical protein FQR65_LT13744 [Abscondita terminalis]|nr:hypothetical protein FQR65_LT13744 [Abscondita terminalis]
MSYKYSLIQWITSVRVNNCFLNDLPTVVEGWKKELEIEDVYETFSEHKSNKLGDKLETGWLKEIRACKGWKKELEIEDVYETFSEHKSNKLGDKLETGWLKEIRACKGWKKELEIEDVYETFSEHKSNKLGDKLEKGWLKEIKNAEKSNRKPSLRRVLLKTFGLELFIYGLIWTLLELSFRVSQPILLGKLITYYMRNYETISQIDLYLYAAGFVACSLLAILLTHPCMLGTLHLGMKMRVACCSLIYRKTLKLSKTSMRQTSVGETLNLLSNDVSRFDVATKFVNLLWVGPLETIIVTYFMYEEVGISAVFGVVILLLFIPLQLYLGEKTATFRLRTALRTDKRIRLMNELISGMQVIKMYCWEKPYTKFVNFARKYEIKAIRLKSYITGVTLSFGTITSRLSLFVTIMAYLLLGYEIDAKKVFVLIGFYNVLRQTMTVFFPLNLTQLAEANVSINRLNTFLLHDEIQVSKWTKKDDGTKYGAINKTDAGLINTTDNTQEDAICIENGTAKWLEFSIDNTFTNLNLYIKRGSSVAVIGPVGSGKSSLLHIILKELPLLDGRLKINGNLSYASQEPWIFPGNVRQNILFGEPWKQDRYETVVKKCSLEHDFSLFPYGDRTLVGERGVSLSGGQRARINLARAIYREADIYLMDDPLSSVDAHVSKELFDKCIKEFLRNKTVILITHQFQYLKDVDYIIILESGVIKAEGTFQKLQNSGVNFVKLLKQDCSQIENAIFDNNTCLQDQTSTTRLVEKVCKEPQQIKEQRTSGTVSSYVYTTYFKSGANTLIIIIVALLFILAQFIGSFADYFLAYWVNIEQSRTESGYHNLKPVQSTNINNSVIYVSDDASFFPQSISKMIDVSGNNTFLNQNDSWFLSNESCIYIYSVTALALILVTLMKSFAFMTLCMNASTRLHDNMFNSIIHATMNFFYTNTSGRILNRFSKDMGTVDDLLPATIFDSVQIGLMVIGIIVVVGIVNYWLLIPTFLIVLATFALREFYLTSSRSIKRLEGITRSPVFTYMNATLQGLTTIRSYGNEAILEKEFDNHQDTHSCVWYLFLSTSEAFGLWLDLLCVIYIGTITISFLTVLSEQFGGNIGLALTQVLTLALMSQWGIRQSAEMENNMTSVERVLEYSKIQHERDFFSSTNKKPPEFWPDKGKIKFINLSLRYSSKDPPVLKNINFTINGLEKIGIVGRTGAGKSSLIQALFQLIETEGSIIIDSIDIQTLGLHDLRSKISIIPQRPVLFSGTLRTNLDPFNDYSDEILWKSLEDVELKDKVNGLFDGLNSVISEGGSNFSVGERQLLCLARAIIRNNKILVLDEATANIDPQTDALIQKTIRKKFSNCTVLTIAHRLHTVIDSDKIMVMDAGRLVEFNHPYLLLQDEHGTFYSMVQQTGNAMVKTLTNIARENYKGLVNSEIQ